MANKRGPLGELADRIRRKSPLPVFPMKGAGASDQMTFWDGDSVEDFLELSKQFGAHAIYISESVVERSEEDERDPEHRGETEPVEAAFLLDGLFHVYEETGPWFQTEEEEGDGTLDEATRVETALESTTATPCDQNRERLKQMAPHLPDSPLRFAILATLSEREPTVRDALAWIGLLQAERQQPVRRGSTVHG